MHTNQPRMSLVASSHKEDGRGHHHPKHPGKEEVSPSPIPAVDEGIPEEWDDESDPGAYHDFEDGFHTW